MWKLLVSTIAALAMPIFVPVPYVEITKRPTSHFPLDLVYTVRPGHGIAVNSNPLRNPNGTAERFPGGTDSSFTRGDQCVISQVLHPKQRAPGIKTGARHRKICGNVIARVMYVGQNHTSNPIDGVGWGGEES